MKDLITSPGCYDGIPSDDYHGREICDGPSISSSGLRMMLKAPRKYWHDSPMNPNRTSKPSCSAFEIGHAAHDLVLMGSTGWADRYHRLPEGFSRSATVKQAAAIAEANAAEARGLRLLKHEDYETVLGMAKAISEHSISRALTAGKPEQTLCWKDKETGVWLRCRPDWLPDARKYIPDYKTALSANPEDFARDVANYGYYQQAALYLEGIEAVFGDRPLDFYFIVQEKASPYLIQPMNLDREALDFGDRLNRDAIRLFAKCLEKNEWPGYAEDIVTVRLPSWHVRKIMDTPY